MTALSIPTRSFVSTNGLTVSNGTTHDNNPAISPYFRDFDFGNLLQQWTTKDTPSRGNSPTDNFPPSNPTSNGPSLPEPNPNIKPKNAGLHVLNGLPQNYPKLEPNGSHENMKSSSFLEMPNYDSRPSYDTKSYYNRSYHKYFDTSSKDKVLPTSGYYGLARNNSQQGASYNDKVYKQNNRGSGSYEYTLPEAPLETNLDLVGENQYETSGAKSLDRRFVNSYAPKYQSSPVTYNSRNDSQNFTFQETSKTVSSQPGYSSLSSYPQNVLQSPKVKINPASDTYKIPKRSVTTLDMKVHDANLAPKSKFSNDNLNYERTWSFLDNKNQIVKSPTDDKKFSENRENYPIRFKSSQSDYILGQNHSPVSPVLPIGDFHPKRELDLFEDEMMKRQNRGKMPKPKPLNSLGPKTSSLSDKVDQMAKTQLVESSKQMEQAAENNKKMPSVNKQIDQLVSPLTDLEATSSWELISPANRESNLLSYRAKNKTEPNKNNFQSVMSETEGFQISKIEPENVVYTALSDSPGEIVQMTQSPRKPLVSTPSQKSEISKTKVVSTKSSEDSKIELMVKDLGKIQDKISFTNQKWFQIETLKLVLMNWNHYPSYYKEELEKHAIELCVRHDF